MNGLNSSSAILLRRPHRCRFRSRTTDDHRTPRVVDTLTEQVLTKTSLLTFERSAQRLQRTIVNATQHATATTVIKQRIDRFLKHALFVAHDYFGRAQLHQLLETVVTVDDAAIEIVDIRSRNTSAIQRNEWTQLRWNPRNHVEDHPVGTIA